MKKRNAEAVYSGPKAKSFWEAVNSTGNLSLWKLAVELQNKELEVLKLLRTAKPRRRGKGKR